MLQYIQKLKLLEYWAAFIYHHFDFLSLLLDKKTVFCFSPGRFKIATLPLYVINKKIIELLIIFYQFIFTKIVSDKIGKVW